MPTVVEMKETDVIAKAPNCFDLPMAQAVQIIKTDEGNEIVVSNLVTCWQFTKEEFEAALNNDRKFYVRLVTSTTPPIAVSAENPFDFDDIMTLKEAVKASEEIEARINHNNASKN